LLDLRAQRQIAAANSIQELFLGVAILDLNRFNKHVPFMHEGILV
jgi:hypothetical protein